MEEKSSSEPDGEDDHDAESSLRGLIFHWGMIFLSLALVFILFGGLFFIVINFSDLPSVVKAKTTRAAWGQFMVGGTIGVGGLILRYFTPLKKGPR